MDHPKRPSAYYGKVATIQPGSSNTNEISIGKLKPITILKPWNDGTFFFCAIKTNNDSNNISSVLHFN